MNQQGIVKFNIRTYNIIEELIDVIGNFKQMDEQILADLYLNGINTEIKDIVIQELINKILLMETNIIIMKHD